MKKLAFLVFFALVGTNVWAQNGGIVGKVEDAAEKAVLPGAHVLLKGPVSQAGISDDNGLFRFTGLPGGTYKLEITYLGFDTLRQDINLARGENKWLGTLYMATGATLLGEVEIKGKQVLATQKGDTTSYNADAYKTNPDATTEDLVRKMAGITVDGSGVQAQGEQVQEVLVDGKPFFGNDPSAALKNLPAQIVSRIQIFDRASDEDQASGYESGETIKSMNIILKPGMSNGTFGRAYGGYGYDEVYQAGANVNLFNEAQRITVLGQSNNINQQNFSSEDLAGITAGGGGGRRWRGRGGSAGDFLVGQQPGISTTHSAGLNYSDEWGEKVEISGSYFFNNNNNTADQQRRQTFFSQEEFDQIYEEDNQSENKIFNNRMNMRLEWELDDRNSLLFRPRLSAQSTDRLEFTTGQTSAGSNLINTSRYSNSSSISALDLESYILYRHNFDKRGRSLVFNLENGYEQNNGESFLLSELTSINRPNSSDTLDQWTDIAGDGWSVEGEVRYTEPLGKKGQLQLEYEINYQVDDAQRETFNFIESSGEYEDLVPGLSNVYKTDYTTHEPGIGYRWGDRKMSFNFTVNAQWAVLDGTQEFPASENVNRRFFSVLPRLFARVRFDNNDQLRFGYRSRTRAPSINQLQNVVDNSNPLQLRTGNPNLDQNFEHSLFFRYNRTHTERSSVFYLMGYGGYTANYIANSTLFSRVDTTINGVLIPAGGQMTLPVNLDGYWNARMFLTYGFPLSFVKSNLNLNLGTTFTRQPGQVDQQLNFSKSTVFDIGVTISSNISENLDFTIGSRSNIGLVRNTLQQQLDNQYFNQQTELGVVWTFGPAIVFRTNLTHQLYTGLSEGFDQNFVLWNANLGKKFLKNNRAELNLSVFDILGQNASVTRNVTETFFEDVTTQVLQRYVMLNFIYNFQNFKGFREKSLEEEDRRRW